MGFHLPAASLVLVSCFASGCAALDVREPIYLVPSDQLEVDDIEQIEHAAECWNLRFGTAIAVDSTATGFQAVPVSVDELTCVYGAGMVPPGTPKKIQICAATYERRRDFSATIFNVVVHELGHVLGINTHGERSHSVMYYAATRPGQCYLAGNCSELFTQEDADLFEEANPDYHLPRECSSVRLGREGCFCVR